VDRAQSYRTLFISIKWLRPTLTKTHIWVCEWNKGVSWGPKTKQTGLKQIRQPWLPSRPAYFVLCQLLELAFQSVFCSGY